METNIAFLKEMYAESAEGFLLIDNQAFIAWNNSSAQKMVETPLLGRNIKDIITSEERPVQWPPIIDQHIRRQISGITFEYLVTPVIDTDLYLVSVRNLDAENSIKPEMEKNLSLFIARIFHDVRSALNGVMGMTDIVLESIRPDPHQSENCELLELSLRNGKELVKNLDSFMVVSQLERGVGSIRPEEINLFHFIQKSFESWAPACKRHNVTLKRQSFGENFTVNADKRLLNIAVNNLLSNALEAIIHNPNQTATTGREINIRFGKRNKCAIITVSNPGYITPENQTKLFNNEFSTKPDGNGLGTGAIATIAKAHNGEASVECTNGLVYVSVSIPD